MFTHRYKRILTDGRGFSLAEVLVAIGIFAILAAIATPQFIAFRPKNRLNGAARQIYSELMWARSKAVTENGSYMVTFRTKNECKSPVPQLALSTSNPNIPM